MVCPRSSNSLSYLVTYLPPPIVPLGYPAADRRLAQLVHCARAYTHARRDQHVGPGVHRLSFQTEFVPNLTRAPRNFRAFGIAGRVDVTFERCCRELCPEHLQRTSVTHGRRRGRGNPFGS